MKILSLPPSVAEKIAAGEVVERPASVVKELVENSLDAGAREVRVELVDGGKALIRVADDGAGMGADDAAVCFRRHATSKIATEDDLERISTLGFRGEALASISAVSRIVLRTADGGPGPGTQIEREGSRLVAATEIAFPRGTTIEIRDLFFNLPARRKFLRSGRSEIQPIARAVTYAALAYPGVRFALVHDGRTLFDVPAVAGLRERIFQLYGKDVLEGLIPVAYRDGDLSVEGFASAPLRGRADRGRQLFFVNRRPVKDRTAQAALQQAYRNLLEKDRSPEAFLFVALPFGDVDVNVHPAKSEIRFRDSQAVFRLVLRAIEASVAAASVSPAVKPVESVEGASGVAVTGGFPLSGADGAAPGRVMEERPLPMGFSRRPESTFEDVAGAEDASSDSGDGFRVLGQYQDMYVVATSPEGLLVVDQHNAHERILFEKFREIDRARTWPRKAPLFPVIVELTPAQEAAFLEDEPLLRDLGFTVEPMGGRSFALKEYPDVLDERRARDLFLALLEDRDEARLESRRERALATMACRAAVKAGQPLPREKMEFLVRELFRTSQPALCPHGRPILVRLEKSKIDQALRRPSKSE